MAVSIVRKTSETPNISVADDTRMCRYAFGNQNGYIIGKGNELGYEVDGTNFTIKSGEFVVQGYQCAIDAEGVTVTVDSLLLSRNYSIYAKVNLATETVTVHNRYALIGYPTLPESDDLTALTTGSAYVELYRFDVMSNEISGVEKRIAALEYYAKPTGTYPGMTVGTAQNTGTTLAIANFDINSIAGSGSAYAVTHPAGKTYADVIGVAYSKNTPYNAIGTQTWHGSTLLTTTTNFYSNPGSWGVLKVINFNFGSTETGYRLFVTVIETGVVVAAEDFTVPDTVNNGTLTLFYK
jgi:hypothetical protein